MSNRRDFLRNMAALALGFGGYRSLSALQLHQADGNRAYGYGELIPDKNGLMHLPKGFSYKIIAEKGQTMNDGLLLPGRGDGMGTFRGSTEERVILIRNHENGTVSLPDSPFGEENKLLSKIKKEKLFDYGFGKTPHLGGTTTTVFNESKQQVERVFMSLAGTSRNCAGGITPWGSWLTCEEDFRNPDDINEQGHGYVFEVPATEDLKLKYPVPLRAMGKFNHEAVAIDARSGVVYLTEDRPDGLFYRFIPKVKGKLHEGGKLQALSFVWTKKMDTRNWEKTTLTQGTAYAVQWIDLTEVDGDTDDLRYRGFEAGAACFARGEGAWAGKNGIYFACTNGGKTKTGQIFRYIPSRYEGTSREKEKEYQPKLELFAEPNDTALLKYVDNLTVAPWGDVVFCEDHTHQPAIGGITPSGKYYRIALNTGYPAEWAGGCFSPSGKTFFVNIQDPGITLAITGPWDKRKE